MTRITFRILSLAFLWAVSGASGAERVWTGGGGDALWSNPANWTSGTPAAGDTLVFGASAVKDVTNDLEAGTAFAGISFLAGSGGKYTLSGNTVTLDGDIRSEASAATVALPLVLSGDRQCLASNATVTLSGVISGPGGLWIEGQAETANSFEISGDNTFEGPVVLTNRTTLTVSSPTALGSIAAGTTVYGTNATSLKISGGITLAEPLTLSKEDMAPQWLPNLYSVSGTNVLTGPVLVYDGFRFKVNASQALVFRGGIIQTDKGGGVTCYLLPQAGAQIIVTNRPLFIVSSVPIELQGGGQLVLAEPGNNYGRLLIEQGCTVRTDAPNALSPYGKLEFGLYSDNRGGTLDLNGFSQTVGPLVTAAIERGRMVVTSAVPATLTVIQRAASVFRGDIAGAVSLVKMGDYTLTFTNAAPMTTTGSVTVASGTLELGNTSGSSGGFGAASVVRVLPGGTLAVNNGSSLPDAAEVSVLGTGKLDIRASVTETVCKLFLDGVQQVDGTWGRTGSGADHINDTFFTGGTGKLLVTDGPGATVYADATWDDGGATNLLTAQANWVGDTLPAFSGSERAVFGTAGSAAGIDTAASFYKLTVNRDANFNLTDLGGSLTLGRGGIEAGVAGTARSHTINAPVTMGDDQFLFLTNSTLYVENTLSDGGRGAGLTLSGGGTMYLDGDNTYGGKTTVRAKSALYVKHSHALGNAVGDTLIEDGGYFKLDAGYGNGITVEDPILLTGDVTTGYGGTIRNSSGTNVLSGPITAYSSQTRIQNSGGTLDIIGGITADANGAKFVIVTSGSGVITRIREKPVFAHHFYASGWTGGTFIFAVSGNVTRLCYLSGSVRLDTPNAFHYLGNLMIGADGGATTVADVDLNGYDLTACQLSTPALFSYARMFSEAPATLTVDQSVNSTYGGSFTGAVSLVKRGAGTLTLTNELGNATTTSGGVTVKAGTLTVAGTLGSLGPNCTNITVEGSGTLALAGTAASMLSDDATVRLDPASAGSAKISLAAGVDETVGWLFCGDRLMYPGTYGATGSGAEYVDSTRFAGTGVLRVLHGKLKGTLIGVR